MLVRLPAAFVAALLVLLLLPGSAAQSGSSGRADITVIAEFSGPVVEDSFQVVVENIGPDATTVIVTAATKDAALVLSAPSGCAVPCVFELASGGARDLTFSVSGATADGSAFTVLAFPVGSIAGDHGVYYSRVDRQLSNNRVAGTAQEAAAASGEDVDAVSGEDPDRDVTAEGGNNDQPEGSQQLPRQDGPGSLTLSLTGPATGAVGENLSYSLTVTNSGTRPGAVFFDAEGGHIHYFEHNVPCFRRSDGGSAVRMRCTVPVGPKGSPRLNLYATAGPSSSSGTLTIIAEARTFRSEHTLTERVVTEIGQATADLELVSFTATPASVKVGERVQASLQLHNHGPQKATDAYAEMDVPEGMDSGSLAGTPCVKHGENKIRCFMGTIESGKTKKLEFGVTASMEGDFPVTARAGASAADRVLGNNLKTVSVTVEAAPVD